MARAGILFSHVAAAAAQVAADGRNPTVDTVREALGDTGSKSTIAPLLKRWKQEQSDKGPTGGIPLPAGLAEAVRALNERMEEDAARRVDETGLAHQAELAHMRDALDHLEAKLAQAQTDHASAAAALEQANTTITQLREAQQAQEVELASARAECAGLTERLADRGAEVNASTDQLRQVRTQFEHYQTAAAAQRSEERQSFERRIGQNEHELGRLREQASSLQAASAETSGQLSTLRSQTARLQDELAQERRHAAAAQSACDRLAADAERLAIVPAALKTRLGDMTKSLAEARTALAVRERELSLSEERRLSAERDAAARAAETVEMAYRLAGMDKAVTEKSPGRKT